MSFLNTIPAAIRPWDEFSTWNRFHIGDPFERAVWLNKVCQSDLPVTLGQPGGDVLTVSLWSVDQTGAQLHFSAEASEANRETVRRLATAAELWGAVYVDDQKFQFLMTGLDVVVRSGGLAISCDGPQDMYRLARRQGQRIKGWPNSVPVAQVPMDRAGGGPLTVRVADLGAEGCGLRLCADVTVFSPGQELHGVEFEFDELTYLVADLKVLHVTPEVADPTALRVGCRWLQMSPLAEKVLQRWIHRGRRPRDLLSLDL